MIEFIDKTSERAGTPINRDNLMAIQGFDNNNIVFNTDGSITQTNNNNEVFTITPFNAQGIATHTFIGEKTITKTITLNPNKMTEVIE